MADTPGQHTATRAERVRVRIEVRGVVQGVGFRPFVNTVARRLALTGFVGNDERGVFLEVEGRADAIDRFVATIESDAPPLAAIHELRTTRMAPRGDIEFTIVESHAGGARRAVVTADAATCDDCLRELFDPDDRRYRYPFLNCTNCGPRFTIVRDVPYDRARTTMAGFAMCPACAREYHDPTDRRFHAQPVCCPACGPRLRFRTRADGTPAGDPIAHTVTALRAGAVVAVKGLGGYHLAARAQDEAAVHALRTRKHREEKPFALMVPDLDAARALADLDAVEAALLADHRRPIVLLRRRADARVATSVAPGTRWLGLMLPYTPLHHLLLHELAEPIVLTSGNVSDEPIAYDDLDARRRLTPIADAFLDHDRPIHTRTDDSVARVVDGRARVVRRSRGYAPTPLTLPIASPRPLLACGAELKSTFCVAQDAVAFVSHHIGDLENAETFTAFLTGIEHYERLFAIEPDVVVHDLHPEYLSTKYALERDGVAHLGVQHHHAHVAACLAEHGTADPVIGVAFDGLGFGDDGTFWGGEILVADLVGSRRVGHFVPVAMPGGAAAIREPWRMAAAYLAAAGDTEGLEALRARHGRRLDDVLALVARDVRSPAASSVGRLFDAVAAVAGLRDVVTYEGQAAIELEQAVDDDERGTYAVPIVSGAPFVIDGVALVAAAAADLRAGVPTPAVAARVHHALANVVVDAAVRVRTETDLHRVALSGGVFQNVHLLERAGAALSARDFDVLTHERVPANDGGISFGQAAIAAARDAAGLIPAAGTGHP